MSYLAGDLIKDVLPRVGKIANNGGITIWSAANSIQSLLVKKLLDRKSDLLATGKLDLAIPADGYKADLPPDFISVAERPQAVEKALIQWVNDAGQTVDWTNDMGETVEWAGRDVLRHTLDPTYLNDDREHEDYTWWEWYGIYGETWEPPSIRPRHYKILGTTMFVRPKVIVDIMIEGRYHAKRSVIAKVTDTIPWNNLFDEIFKEGVVRIIQKQISIPDADPDFMLFFHREFDSVINSRMSLIPSTRRLKRANWM